MSRRLKFSTTLISLLLLAISANANARDQYIGGAMDINGDQNAQAVTLSGRYGILAMASTVRGLALYAEVRAAIGITEAGTKISDTDVDVKIENLVGAYGSLRYRIGSTNFTPYITLGFTRVSFKGTALSEVSVRDSDVSFGGGLDWEFNDKWTLKVDGMRYLENSYGSMAGVSVGVSRWFK